MPLLYRPEETRRQNIIITIPGSSPEGRPNQQELVLTDVVDVPLKYAREVLGGIWGSDWAVRYAITVHSSQGFTIADPQKVIDDYLRWSNLAYLAVTRVEHPSQLDRVVCPRRMVLVRQAASLPRSRRSPRAKPESAQSSRRNWWPTSVKTRLKGYDLTSRSIILGLKEAQSNRCAKCNIELLGAYQQKDT